jgi:glucose/arabinose dehydrogenase
MSTSRTTARLLILTLIAGSLTAIAFAPTASAGSSIDVVKVKGGLQGPAGFTFLPSGKILYAERGTGEIRVLNIETKSTRSFFHIRGVNGEQERGALGVAVHPKWPEEPFVYVYATRNVSGHLRNQIVRIRAAKRTGSWHGVGMKVLVSSPASSAPYHNGGRIAFGPDGRLYAIVGDGHNDANAQDLSSNLRGKILRLRADGGVPADNPMIDGNRTRMFAYGIRNSFGFAFDPDTDDLWETENGPLCNDEVNRIVAGENYGWGPSESCPDTNNSGPSPRLPLVNYPSTIGITGAVFCDGCGLGFEGDLFWGACCDGGSLHRGVLNTDRDDVDNVVDVLDAPGGSIYSMERAPDGRIYFSDASAIYRLAPA